MCFLIDSGIQAGSSEIVAEFEDTGLVDVIVRRGAGALGRGPPGIPEGSSRRQQRARDNRRRARDEQKIRRDDVFTS